MEYLKIGEASRVLGVSVSTVRLWEKGGLLKVVRTAKGQRLFRREDVERLRPKEATSA